MSFNIYGKAIKICLNNDSIFIITCMFQTDLSSNTCCVNTQFKQNLEKNTAVENIVIRQIMTGVLIFMTPMTK